MVYRFDAEWNGEVVAEERRPGLEPFLGLRYPASDIPPQARALYSRTRLRLIPDATRAERDRSRSADGSASALDLSDVAFRARVARAPPVPANMGVRASMSVAIHVGGRLWGLIACHHLTEPLRRRSDPQRGRPRRGGRPRRCWPRSLASESAAIRVDLLDRLDALTEPPAARRCAGPR